VNRDRIPRDKRGSVLAMVVVYSLVVAVALGLLLETTFGERRASMRHYMRTAAHHLAEGAIEQAAAAVVNGESETWPLVPSTQRRYTVVSSIPDFDGSGGRYGASYVVLQETDPADATVCSIRAVARVRDPLDSLEVEVALEARFNTQSGGGQGPGYALISREWTKFNFSSGAAPFVGSYDSSAQGGIPERGVNTGYDALVGVGGDWDGALEMNNVVVHGTVRTGGGIPTYSQKSGYSAVLRGPKSDVDFDTSRLAKDFSHDFSTPTLPEIDADWTRIEPAEDSDPFADSDSIVLGENFQKTYVRLGNLDTTENATITIAGEVVLHLERNLNLHGSLELMPGASLAIYANENINITARGGDWAPSQLEVNMLGGADVVVNGDFDVFSGRINAPDSYVRLHGTLDIGTLPDQVRGQVIGGTIEITNGVQIFYDTRIGAADSAGTGLRLLEWSRAMPSTVKQLLPTDLVW
jgi:hypothetical protein